MLQQPADLLALLLLVDGNESLDKRSLVEHAERCNEVGESEFRGDLGGHDIRGGLSHLDRVEDALRGDLDFLGRSAATLGRTGIELDFLGDLVREDLAFLLIDVAVEDQTSLVLLLGFGVLRASGVTFTDSLGFARDTRVFFELRTKLRTELMVHAPVDDVADGLLDTRAFATSHLIELISGGRDLHGESTIQRGVGVDLRAFDFGEAAGHFIFFVVFF